MPLDPARELALDHGESLLNKRHLFTKLGAAAAAVLRVHVTGDGLQKLEQQPLEADAGLNLASRRLDERHGCLFRAVLRGDVSVDVIDDDGVETLLGVERRPDHAPDESAKPAFERAIDRRPPARSSSRDSIARPGWRRETPAAAGDCRARAVLMGAVERRQRVVVLPIGGLPFAVEPLEEIREGAFALHLRRRPSAHRRSASGPRRG